MFKQEDIYMCMFILGPELHLLLESAGRTYPY